MEPTPEMRSIEGHAIDPVVEPSGRINDAMTITNWIVLYKHAFKE
jgi:hypothetical protein